MPLDTQDAMPQLYLTKLPDIAEAWCLAQTPKKTSGIDFKGKTQLSCGRNLKQMQAW